MKPDISLYSSAAIPSNWMIQLESMGDNVAKWERICVGPNEPDYTLPDNVRFIRSDVKPVQCNEIGARACRADIIMHLSDDFIFRGTSHPLDSLLNQYESGSNAKNCISPRYMLRGIDRSRPWPNGWQRLIPEDNSSPVMPCNEMMAKVLHISLGGFDRNFVTNYSDVDFAMRIIVNGGRTILSSDVFVDEIEELQKTNLSAEPAQPIDRQYLEALWFKNRDWKTLKRALPFESFSDENILTESQGPKGRWV